MTDTETAARVAALLTLKPTRLGYTCCVKCGNITAHAYACEIDEGKRDCWHEMTEQERNGWLGSGGPPRFLQIGG